MRLFYSVLFGYSMWEDPLTVGGHDGPGRDLELYKRRKGAE